MILTPRWYQSESTEAAWDYIRHNDGNPCIELPTGAGKSLVITMLMEQALEWGGRVVLLAHRKELLEQTFSHLPKGVQDQAGIYSAGLGRKDADAPLLLAGIQSVYKQAIAIGPRHVVIVDEAHLIPPDGDGMYLQFIKDARTVNPCSRVIGLTATPYRLQTGLVCGADRVFQDICYRVGVKSLIAEGWLCKLTSKETAVKASGDGVGKRGGEFIQSQLADYLADDEQTIKAACAEIVWKTADRKSTLVFCAGRDHGKKVRATLRGLGCETDAIDGETSSGYRENVLDRFKRGELPYLVNIDVLTTGFDATCIDCVAMLRPTMSPGLYYQMVGRGLRKDGRKKDCLILDFGGNVERHGPIDKLEPEAKAGGSGEGGEPVTKVCPECEEIVHAAVRVCTDCGHEFPPPETKHDTEATSAEPLSGSGPEPPAEYEVSWVTYAPHTKKGADDSAPKTLRVSYHTWRGPISEWVCVEHSGWPKEKADTWWRERTEEDCPDTAQEAAEAANDGALDEPTRIWVDYSGEFPRIVKYSWNDEPSGMELEEDDIPF